MIAQRHSTVWNNIYILDDENIMFLPLYVSPDLASNPLEKLKVFEWYRGVVPKLYSNLVIRPKFGCSGTYQRWRLVQAFRV